MRWPDGVTFRALGEWWPSTRTLPADRIKSPFLAEWEATCADFEREVRLHPLGVHAWRLYLDINPRNVTKAGRLRDQTRIETPGIVVEIETANEGTNIYAADRFHTWRDNFRAVTLSLEALRAVSRYGLNDAGKQYSGFRQIESGIALGSAPFTTAAAARDHLDGYLYARDAYDPTLDQPTLIRRALRLAHPDHEGGSADAFTRITAAADILKRETA